MPGACTSYNYTNLSGRGTLHLDWEEGTTKAPHKNVNFSTRRDGRRLGIRMESTKTYGREAVKENAPFRKECW